jgi:hypothetical protein
VTAIRRTGQRMLVAALLALGLSTGLIAATLTPALANDGAFEQVWNYTNCSGCGNLGIGVDFHTTSNTWTYQVVYPGSWQGETSGNKSWEPRDFRVGPGYCVMYAFRLWGQSKGTDYWVCGGGAGLTQNIYFGDGNTQSYNTLLEKVFYRGY